jgi:hypothetical protein
VDRGLDIENEVASLKMLLLDRENEINRLRGSTEGSNSYRQSNTQGTDRETYELLLSEKDYEIEMLSGELQRIIKRQHVDQHHTPTRSMSHRGPTNELDLLKKQNNDLHSLVGELEQQVEEMKQIVLRKEEDVLALTQQHSKVSQTLHDARYKEDYLEKKVIILTDEL